MTLDAFSNRRSLIHWLRIFFSGICMGAADIVPGISGGTVAFILGIYSELIESLKSMDARAITLLLTLKLKEFGRTTGWRFILALVSGITISFITLSRVFNSLLNHEIYRVYLYSAFFGLIIASVWVCAKQLRKWKFAHFIGLAVGAIIAFALTGSSYSKASGESVYDVEMVLPSMEQSAINYDRDNKILMSVPASTLGAMLSKGVINANTLVRSKANTYHHAFEVAQTSHHFGLDLWMICCGAIAISAMLLPGISGSYLLSILGVYGIVIMALADFLNGIEKGIFETEAFVILLSMLIGIVLGAIMFSRVVSWMLKHYHDMTIAILTGFMIGALRAVWPFWTYVYYYLPLKLEKGPQLAIADPYLPGIQETLLLKGVLFAVAGFIVVFILEGIATRFQTAGKL